ncbi:MAG TPA: NAD-binding protein [Steroidobacteraceae bacterium]|nr:NAD-binding protein [Steroidobacteraceae bacterium]
MINRFANRMRRLRRGAPFDKILFTVVEARPGRVLAARATLVLGLLVFVVGALWLERDGIRDQVDGELTFIDLVYFTVISLTTVGYGDIIPVTERARLIDAVILTPARLLVWLVFVGTAFELFFHKGLERIRMMRLQRQLAGHLIVCGYGHSGRTAAAELVSRGTAADQVVVVDADDALLKGAAEAGHIGLRGDATMQRTLQDAGVTRAAAIIVATGRDDTNALVVLTVRQLNPGIRVIATVREEENGPLLRQAGADITVTPSRIAGYLLADAVAHRHVNDFVLDVLSSGGRLMLVERPARRDEHGRPLGVVGRALVLRILRGGTPVGFWEAGASIAEGDVLLALEPVID